MTLKKTFFNCLIQLQFHFVMAFNIASTYPFPASGSDCLISLTVRKTAAKVSAS